MLIPLVRLSRFFARAIGGSKGFLSSSFGGIASVSGLVLLFFNGLGDWRWRVSGRSVAGGKSMTYNRKLFLLYQVYFFSGMQRCVPFHEMQA